MLEDTTQQKKKYHNNRTLFEKMFLNLLCLQSPIKP
jgi:hypothetical protein